MKSKKKEATDRELNRPPDRTRPAIMACAKWLSACIRFGWDKSQLDALESIWWKHHDARGNLIGGKRG